MAHPVRTRLPMLGTLVQGAAIVLAAATAMAQHPDTAAVDTAVVRLRPLEAVASILPAAGLSSGTNIPARTTLLSPGSRIGARTNLIDVMTAQPVAVMHDDLGSPFKQTITLRGFHASPVVGLPQGVTVFVDGIGVNEPGAGEVNLELLPLEFAEHIEILHGTSSLLGPNALGGAVNIITRRSVREPEFRLEAAGGTYGLRRGVFQAGGTIRQAAWFSGVVHEREDGWRDRMRGERTVVHAALATPQTQRGVGLTITAGRSHAQTAGSLPLSVYQVKPDSNLTAGDFELIRQLAVVAHAHTTLGSSTANARLHARLADAERFNVNQVADPDVRGFSDSRTVGLDFGWNTNRGAFELRVGGGGLINRTAIELHAERIDPGLTTDVESPITRGYLHAIAGIQLGRWRLTAGARGDFVRVPFHNLIDPARDTTSVFRAFSPRAGVSFNPSNKTLLYASISRGFRPPALIEIACADPEQPCPLPFALGDDPPIDPVTVTTWESGFRWVVGPIIVDAAAYRSDVRNDIFLFPYEEEDEPAGSTIDGYFDNVPRTRREGMEASLQGRLPGQHSAFLSYAFTRATFQSDGIELFSIREAGGFDNDIDVGDRFPLVPEHALSAGIELQVINALRAGAVLRYVGERYLRGDEANNDEPLPASTTLDLHAEYEAHGATLRMSLRNATAARYFTYGAYNINQGNENALERFVTPGAPRRLEISLAAKWQP